MKKNTYIQLGLVLVVALGVYLLRTREGFEEIKEAKCPEGRRLLGTACFDLSDRGTAEPICPPNSTADQGNTGICLSPDGPKQKICPDGKPTVMGGCYESTPLCDANTEGAHLYHTETGFFDKLVCVPKNRETYDITLPEGRPPTPDEVKKICRPGDKIIGKSTELEVLDGIKRMCLSMTPSPGTTTTPPSGVQPRDTDSTPNAIITSSASSIREVIDSLKPFRPPTAPSSDLEKERKEITELAKRNLFFAQVALLLVVLAGLCYLVMDRDSANLIALALLLVGIAVGFFLRR